MKKLLVIVATIFISLPLFAEARNALLIANNNYKHFGTLSTPIKESRDLKESLVRLGFSVTVVENGSREKMLDALSDFEDVLNKNGGIGFFHYGGHAVQVNGKNYLIPVDADIPDEKRVATRAIVIDELMSSMVADTNIVIIDACRDSPLPSGTRSGTRGLTLTVPRVKNSIVVFSADEGQVAQDGIFTPVLTKKLLENKSLNEIIIDVRNEVLRLTNNAQYPETRDRLVSTVYLSGNATRNQNYVPQNSSVVDSQTGEDYYNLGYEAYHSKDYSKAAEYYQKAIDLGYTYAQNNLGVCYENGFGVPQNYAKAAELYKKAAEEGVAIAQCNIGIMYHNGTGVSQDYNEARKWYLKASEQGIASAQFNLGLLYEFGLGVTKDTNTALSYYQMAANQGHERAIDKVSSLLNSSSVSSSSKWLFPLYGMELGKTPVSELKKKGKKEPKYDYYKINGQNFWYENNVFDHMYVTKSSWIPEWTDAGYDPNLSYNGWISFLKSQGYEIFVTEKPTSKKYDFVKTDSLCAKIVAKRTTPVNHGIELDFDYSGKTGLSDSGTLYSIRVDYNGYSYVTRANYPDDGSSSLNQKSVANKTAEEYFNLGWDAAQAQNYGKAVEYYQSAANMGHSMAQNNLAYCYENGFGVPKSDAKAAELYLKSAENGNYIAQCNIGIMYHNGKGVAQNYVEARKWYLKAAEQGNVAAKYNLGLLYEFGLGVTKDIDTALSYYQMAANQGHEKAKDKVSSLSNSLSASNSSQWIFSAYGLTLGKSSLSDVKKKSQKTFANDTSGKKFEVNGHLFECNDKGILSHIMLFDPTDDPWPQELINRGFNPNYSYAQWKNFLISQGYTITEFSDDETIDAEKDGTVYQNIQVDFYKGKTDSLSIWNY